MKRQRRVHYAPHVGSRALCGAPVPPFGASPQLLTQVADDITCRVCMFHYLAQQAPWASAFLADLRAADPSAKTSEGARLRREAATPGC
jgi:hypothetical protein